MDAGQYRKHEACGRVLGFCHANPDENAGTRATVLHLESLFERTITLSSQQRSGRITEKAAAVRRQIALDATLGALRHLRTIGHAGSKDVPGLALLFQVPPQGVSQVAIVTAARTNLAEAEARKDFLLSKGMAPTLLADLAKSIADVEQSTNDFHTGRRAHVGATADMDRVMADIMADINHLDGINRYRFRDNPELLAAWASARDIAWRASKQTGNTTGTNREYGGNTTGTQRE